MEFNKKSFLNKMPFKILIARTDFPISDANMMVPLVIKSGEKYKKIQFKVLNLNELKEKLWFLKIQNCDSGLKNIKLTLENSKGEKVKLEEYKISTQEKIKKLSLENLQNDFITKTPLSFTSELFFDESNSTNYLKIGLIKFDKGNIEEIKNMTELDNTPSDLKFNEDSYELIYKNEIYSKDKLKEFGSIEFHISKSDSEFKSKCGVSRVLLDHFESCSPKNCSDVPYNNEFYNFNTERSEGKFNLDLSTFKFKENLGDFKEIYAVWKTKKKYKKVDEYIPVSIQTSLLVEISEKKEKFEIENLWKFFLYFLIFFFCLVMLAVFKKSKKKVEEEDKRNLAE